MQFPDSWFEDEVREGFFIAGMMKRAWAAQLQVLSDVAEVCKRHQITYYADFGTLLGAVRHRGFIPWDDDLDICMKREDYDRFLAAADELPEGYFVRNIHTDETYTELFTRVINSREINFEAEFLEKFHGCPYGMGIDVFVLDDLAPDEENEARQMQMIQSVLEMIEELDAGTLDEKTWSARKEQIEKELSVKTDCGRSLKNQMFLLLEKLFSMYMGQGSEELAVMPLWIQNKECRMKKVWYQETVELPFETAAIPAPAFYDAVLQKKYGQYMASSKMGGSHDYPLYRKQEKALKQQVGINPYTYVISGEDLARHPLEDKMTVKKQIRTCLQLLQELQDELKNLLFEREQQRYGEHRCLNDMAAAPVTGKAAPDSTAVLNLLTKCQETAITLGTCIESVRGEGTASVAGLEAYCEKIYRIYEAVSAGEKNILRKEEKTPGKLAEEIAASVKREIDLRQEAVFLPCRAAEWDALESVWRAAEEDPECSVFVIPIPWFSRKFDGSLGEMHYEAGLFPPYVSLTDYHAFDYDRHCPDVIYIQNPYDAYNLSMSVHPFFYSENLKKYTERLVYLPPFIVNEITAEDQRAVENIRYSCIVPGVVHADRVIVQSERMRQIYIQILTEAAGEETREIWEEKILGIGSPKTDQNRKQSKEEMNLPKEWLSMMRKSDGSLKKIVLYGTSTAVLIEHREKALEKMKRVFAVFQEKQEEILLFWMPDCSFETGMKEIEPVLWDAYQKLMLWYQKENFGILDHSGDAERAASVCDAYYGDGGYAAQLCIRRGVPVMLQEVEIT